MLAHPLRPPLPSAGDKILPPLAIMNNKLKAFSFIIKLPMRVIPISILNKTFLNLLFANN
ncbi:hypothetical protein [Klebsiella pneumoniae]|uniref:hypothetical protein n=1 Tax=Klebsiella pneumoniae TaxID=573 RepID=UPI0023B351E0|nr:hypothetical protein [Klebsiella pneumoniae]